ncbi:MAG TPA: SRPBCC family protein [Dehalococcoidia bacterium]|nr:SRPBCC family protein [Dehalococcoidia bacterium]
MAHLDITILIDAAPDVVWHVLADLERQGEWMVDVRRIDVVSERKRGAGAVFDVTSELFGLPIVRDVMEITAWDPPRRMDVLHRGQFHGTGSFILDPAAAGTTRMWWLEDFEPPLGRLGELAFRLAVRPHLLRAFGRSLRNLKRLAEARAPR